MWLTWYLSHVLNTGHPIPKGCKNIGIIGTTISMENAIQKLKLGLVQQIKYHAILFFGRYFGGFPHWKCTLWILYAHNSSQKLSTKLEYACNLFSSFSPLFSLFLPLFLFFKSPRTYINHLPIISIQRLFHTRRVRRICSHKVP